jgi:hypothetical protein
MKKEAKNKFDWNSFLEKAIKDKIRKSDAQRAISKIREWDSNNLKNQMVILDKDEFGEYVDVKFNCLLDNFNDSILQAYELFESFDKRIELYKEAKKIHNKLEIIALKLIQKKLKEFERNGLKLVFVQ